MKFAWLSEARIPNRVGLLYRELRGERAGGVAEPTAASRSTRMSCNLLIVDDSPILRKAIKKVAKLAGG